MGRGTRVCSRGLAGAVVLAVLALPGAAAAATKPTATTGVASNVGQTTASLNATVNPNGGLTGYYFQYGTTRPYNAQTPLTLAGSGTKAVHVTQAISGLAPATTYHYRVVAQNPKGRVFGQDRTFKTQRQPLGVSLAGNPNPVHAGDGTTLAGTLSGTGNAGRQVVLQSNPWPYTQGFLNAANPQVTDANGNFAFPVLSVPVNTQYRVLMPTKPEVVSPIVVEGTTLRVSTHWRVRRRAHSGLVILSGHLFPASDGTQVIIQKWRNGHWKNIHWTFARHEGASSSSWRKAFWQRHGGRYRAFENAQGSHSPHAGRVIRIRSTHR